MNNIILKVLLLVLAFNINVFGAVEEKMLICNKLDTKYNLKVYRKATVLLTEARLKLQKKYKKFLNFEYRDNLLIDKKAIKDELKKQKARYYVYLDIVDKSKGKCKNNRCKVDYILKLYDGKKNKKYKVKIKAMINNNEFTEIKVGYIKSATKKLVKFLKAR